MADKVKKRIFYFDELRFLAILCVILCHTTTMYKPYYYYNPIISIPGALNLLGYIGVPLFFMISGALLLNRDYTLKEFFKKRFSRILIPFIFWLIITVYLHMTVLGTKPAVIIKLIYGVQSYTWFIWVMIGIYLILPVFNSFIKEYGTDALEWILIIWFITILLSTFGYYPIKFLDITFYGEFIGFPVLGYYLSNYEFSISDRKLMIIGALIFIIFTVYNFLAVSQDIYQTSSSYLSIFTVMSAIGIYLFIKSRASYCNKNPKKLYARFRNKIETGLIGKIIISISVCSYGMYFVNSILFAFIRKLHIHEFVYIPIFFISVVVLSWLIILIMSKIPVIKKLSGAG